MKENLEKRQSEVIAAMRFPLMRVENGKLAILNLELETDAHELSGKTYKNSSFCRFVVICRSHAPENRVHGSGDCILMGKVRY